MKRKILLAVLILFANNLLAQDTKTKDGLTFEEYKKQEQQKFLDFERTMISDLNDFIKEEEEWNFITISQKGNIKDVIINNNNVAKNDKNEIVISKETKKDKKKVKPNYVIENKENSILSNTDDFISPLKGSNYRVSSKFGYRTHPVYKTIKFHGGIDLASPKNTKVYAVKPGIVVHSGYVRGYGNYIVIEHEGAYKSAYAHLNSIKVKQGDKVNGGSVIGNVGKTGTATGYHLHFELIKSNKKIDPKIIV